MAHSDDSVFRLAVEASPNGILVCDESGQIVFANPQVEAIFGYAAGELVGQTVDALVPPERTGHQGFRDSFWRHPEGRGMGAGRELCGLHKNGSLIPVEIGISLASRNGASVVVASVVDISERRALQQQIRRSLDERLAFERVLSTLAARFVNLAPGDIDAAVLDTQKQIVEALDLDRSALWTFATGTEAVCTHSWTRSGYPQIPLRFPAGHLFPELISRAEAGETITITRLDDVPSQIDREGLARFSTKSMVIVPFGENGKVTGAVSFSALRAEREWATDLVERFALVASVFEQAMARRADHEELTRVVAEVRQLRDQLALENTQLRSEVKALRKPRAVVAESRAARRVLEQVEPVAATSTTVLLMGETGSGKEVFAQAIHDMSKRHARPMVRVNCGAIPSALIESELFGRERGAYTGALSRQMGRFEAADGSTIFLDEIAELPLESQVKLLRVIQDKVIERLGSTQPLKVDVRIIAATNRDLERAVEEKLFREDLYYRLNVYPITVPPLRERLEDIPVLVWAFVDEFSKSLGKPIESISKESLAALARHSWPGNVRELRNFVERAMIVATGPRLVFDPPRPSTFGRARTTRLSEMEAEHIRGILDSVGWRVRGNGGAAERLGMKPTTLESRMTKLGIHRIAK